MKIWRFLILLAAGIAFVFLVFFALSAYWQRNQVPFQNVSQLISALQGYSRQQIARGRPLPPEVSLADLIDAGYLAKRDAAAFQGMDVAFRVPKGEVKPDTILIRARTQDGQYICLMGDGSVQNFNSAQYEESLRSSGSQGAPALNTNSPVKLLTPPTPPQ